MPNWHESFRDLVPALTPDSGENELISVGYRFVAYLPLIGHSAGI
jgi:hypothetical protein